jgi:small nuclear ribonucleoprotein (snRNP)-like protein
MAALAESSEVPGAPSSAAAKARLAGLLGRRLRFTLSDERVVVGVFQCVDRLRNFIVTDA